MLPVRQWFLVSVSLLAFHSSAPTHPCWLQLELPEQWIGEPDAGGAEHHNAAAERRDLGPPPLRYGARSNWPIAGPPFKKRINRPDAPTQVIRSAELIDGATHHRCQRVSNAGMPRPINASQKRAKSAKTILPTANTTNPIMKPSPAQRIWTRADDRGSDQRARGFRRVKHAKARWAHSKNVACVDGKKRLRSPKECHHEV